jgi:hypothetical protein
MLWDLFLFFAALAFAALGAVNLGTAPVFAILALLCLVAILIRRMWTERRRSQQPVATPPPSGTAIRFTAPDDAELVIFLDREEFHPFQYEAILLEAKFRVENMTDKTKHIMGTTWAMDPAKDGGGMPMGIEVHRAVYALQQQRPPQLHGTIAPKDTISGWAHVALPWQPWGGVGGYTVTIEDEVGTQYVLRRERRGGREPSA